ncbi:DUF1206 domain-containing protein [Paraflavitalea pollutisoli]|uniref:DUF1206 domain-containing protein n=1 Tax=Paraflavitalea pollutisoli TaxID=3034143 RepID=UPI0023EE0389|nr:DUF1206 domain-containing protein [Paraflavitalea sp. H1-2-19X]
MKVDEDGCTLSKTDSKFQGGGGHQVCTCGYMRIKSHKRTLLHYLPVYGCIATGIIYTAIGAIAILSFLKVREGGADENSLLAILNDYWVGKIAIGLILLGTLSYIIWRFYEVCADPYGYGRGIKGIARRVGVGLSTVADILIVYAAIRVLVGGTDIQTDGQPMEERELTAYLIQHHGIGPVLAIGITYLVTAIIQALYGISQGFRERINIEQFRPVFRWSVQVLAWAGYLARGVILGIIGYFFLLAGLHHDPQRVVNTDKAFDFIGDHVGHLWFILVAIGTICYGLFMFAHGRAYDVDGD